MTKLPYSVRKTLVAVFASQVSGPSRSKRGGFSFARFRFALGLGIAITRNAVHTDTTAVGAAEVKVKLSRTV